MCRSLDENVGIFVVVVESSPNCECHTTNVVHVSCVITASHNIELHSYNGNEYLSSIRRFHVINAALSIIVMAPDMN